MILRFITMKRQKRELITKKLYWYAKYLILVFSFTMILSAGLVVYGGGETCYREPTSHELLYNGTFGMILSVDNTTDDCIIVNDLDVIEKKYNNYKLITILCIIGYLIVQPRKKYVELYDKVKKYGKSL